MNIPTVEEVLVGGQNRLRDMCFIADRSRRYYTLHVRLQHGREISVLIVFEASRASQSVEESRESFFRSRSSLIRGAFQNKPEFKGHPSDTYTARSW